MTENVNKTMQGSLIKSRKVDLNGRVHLRCILLSLKKQSTHSFPLVCA